MGVTLDDVVRAWLEAQSRTRNWSELTRLAGLTDRGHFRHYLYPDAATRQRHLWVHTLSDLGHGLGLSARQLLEELRDMALLMEQGTEDPVPPSVRQPPVVPAPSLADQLRLVAEALEAGKLPPASMASGELRRLGVSAPAPFVAPAAPRPDLDAAAPAPPPRRPRGRPPKLPR